MGAMGAPEDFVSWYEREHPRLIGAALALSGDPDLAAEITDEAFTRALERWERVRAMKSPTGWTYTVAVNLIRRRYRRRGLEDRAVRRSHGVGVSEQSVSSADPNPEMWAAVRALPERQRHVVLLRYVLDLPEAEIAASLEIHRGTVASTLSDARRSLARTLGEQEEPSP